MTKPLLKFKVENKNLENFVQKLPPAYTVQCPHAKFVIYPFSVEEIQESYGKKIHSFDLTQIICEKRILHNPRYGLCNYEMEKSCNEGKLLAPSQLEQILDSMQPYFSALMKMVEDIMKREDRKDAEFRLALFTSQLGDIAKHITHDNHLNPNARPYGSKHDEILAYGQLIAQLFGLMLMRGINVIEALRLGMQNWLDADWRKKKTSSEEIVGRIAYLPFPVVGDAYILNGTEQDFSKVNDKILVVEHFTSDMAPYARYCRAIITDHGGVTCHAACIAREYNIPCVVGTGNATEKIKSNDRVEIIPKDKNTAVIKICN